MLEQDGILSNTAYVPNITNKNMVIVRGERTTNSLTPDMSSLGIERRIERTRGTFLGTTATSGSTRSPTTSTTPHAPCWPA